MNLALVRHGRTQWNRERRMQGRSDIPLDDHGRAQADAAGRILARSAWERIVSSPLARAAESAEIIARHLPGIPVLSTAELTERDYGLAEGLSVADAHERWPAQDYPGAEPLADVARRCATILRELAEQPGGTVVVAHGTVLRVGIERMTGHPTPRILNGEVVTLRSDAQGYLGARFLSS